MKAIIPVAGAGTMLRPHTYTQPKALIPLAGNTILGLIIDQLRQAGVEEFILIVGYLSDKIKGFVADKYPGLKVEYVHQHERRGIGQAIELTEDLVKGAEVLIVLGDTIADYDVEAVVRSSISMLGIKKVDDPRNFGVAETDPDGLVEKVIEKPSIPKSNLALVGIYKIVETGLLFECLHRVTGLNNDIYKEATITEAIQCMIEKEVKFKSFKVSNWFDCGNKASLLNSNAVLLKSKGSKNETSPHYHKSVIIPPVSIGDGVVIKNSVIGPNVSIGENTILDHAVIRNSIIGSFSNISDILLENSLIGSDAEVQGAYRNLNIGDNAAIDLSGSPT